MLDTKFWAKYFKVYDLLNLLIPYQELLRDICDELEIKPREKILEAGCGTGNLALKIKERGARVIGLDNCKEALDLYLKKDPEAEIVLADLTRRLPFPDNYFDKIACNNVLYAISRKKQINVLKELYRILRPDGKIVFVNPQRGWSSSKIYIDGIKKNFKKEGLLPTFYKITRMIIPTIKIFYYNTLLRKEKNYHFFELDEQRKLINVMGFSKVGGTRFVYSGQHLLDYAHK